MTQALCAYAFDAIASSFDASVPLVAPAATAVNGDKFPMFVTWKKRETDDKGWRLRGCIGTFAAQPLLEGIKKYAQTSAFKDSRFKPITAPEVPKLCCHVSLLTNFEPAKDCYDWKVGVHGIQIDFRDSKGESYGATYLPEVASEQGWTQAETIVELVAKSGYVGPVTPQLRSAIKLTRYQSQHAELTHAQWVALRKAPAAAAGGAAAAGAAAAASGGAKAAGK